MEKAKREDLESLASRVVIVNKGGDTIPEAFAIREKAQRRKLKKFITTASRRILPASVLGDEPQVAEGD